MRPEPDYPRLEVEFRWLPTGTEKKDGVPYLIAIADVDAALLKLAPNQVDFIVTIGPCMVAWPLKGGRWWCEV
jgi:hypothetical protein